MPLFAGPRVGLPQDDPLTRAASVSLVVVADLDLLQTRHRAEVAGLQQTLPAADDENLPLRRRLAAIED